MCYGYIAKVWSVKADCQHQLVLSYQLKLIKMRANLASLKYCAVPFLRRAGANLCWYYYIYITSVNMSQNILEPDILVICNMKFWSWIRQYGWLLQNFESSILIGCLLWKPLRTFYYQQFKTPDSTFSVTNDIAGFKTLCYGWLKVTARV